MRSQPSFRVLVTTKEIPEGLEEFARGLNLELVSLPFIDFVPLDFKAPDLKPDFTVFQSKRAVRFFLERYKGELGKIYCVGEKTLKELRKFGLEGALPRENSAEGLLKLFKRGNGEVVFIPRSKRGLELLINSLRERNYRVFPIQVYDTKILSYPCKILLENLREVKAILFSSPSTVFGFFSNLKNCKGEGLLEGKVLVCIGKTTREELRKFYGGKTLTAKRPDFFEMLKVLAQSLQ